MKNNPLSPMPGRSWEDTVLGALQERRASARIRTAAYSTIFLLIFVCSLWVGEVNIPDLIENFPSFFSYLRDISPSLHWATLWADLSDWYWSLGKWLKMILDTVIIAFAGTALGGTCAFLICFPASRNLAPSRWSYVLFRRLAEFCRSVPELVFALIFVFSFGIGPMAGVLALAIHTTGALGKLFSEVNENVDMNKLDGIAASGGNWFQTMRFAVVPQVLPNFLSYGLLRFEINVRQATVIGFVGAGGIGQELMLVIRQFIYTDISAIVLLILILVSLIDMSCEQVRLRIIGRDQGV